MHVKGDSFPAVARMLDPERLGDHVDHLYRAAWGLCGSPHDAEDLVQETYAKVLARTRLLRREDDLGYLLRALRNTFLAARRPRSARAVSVPLDEELAARHGTAFAGPEEAAEHARVYSAIADLPGEYR